MKRDRYRVVQTSNLVYPVRRFSRADFPEPPQTENGPRLEARCCSIGEAKRREIRTHGRVPETARRYPEKPPVMPRQFASGRTGGWFGGAGSGCRPSRAKYRGERVEGPFPVPRMGGRALSDAPRTSPRCRHLDPTLSARSLILVKHTPSINGVGCTCWFKEMYSSAVVHAGFSSQTTTFCTRLLQTVSGREL